MSKEANDKTIDMERGIYRRIYATGLQMGRRINAVSVGAEFWFFRLHTIADDFGNFRADPHILKSTAAPRRAVTAKQIAGWMKELSEVGLVALYSADDEPLGHIMDFERYQPGCKNGKRYKKHPKWVAASGSGCEQVFSGASGCAQVRSVESTPLQEQEQQQDEVERQEQEQVEAKGEDAPKPAGGGISAPRSAAALAAAASVRPTASAVAGVPASPPSGIAGASTTWTCATNGRTHPRSAASVFRCLLLLGIEEPKRSQLIAAIPTHPEAMKWLADLVVRKEAGKFRPGYAIKAIESQFNLAPLETD